MKQFVDLNFFHSFQDYQQYLSVHDIVLKEREAFEKTLVKQSVFNYIGYCHICRKEKSFVVYPNSLIEENYLNWREQLICSGCGLNSRMRAAIFLISEIYTPQRHHLCYLTEQATRFYTILKAKVENLVGSEFLGTHIHYGKRVWKRFGKWSYRRVRNESLDCLTYADNSFDLIFSFDVFEHIPNYQKALSECYRCLKSNGKLLFSVPFSLNSPTNQIRAFLTPDGNIHHILPPEYHGDPLCKNGCLCYVRFGWELIEELKMVGYQDTTAILLWSKQFAHLGNGLVFFIASKD